MSAMPKPKLTPREYLAIERAAEFKSEFYDGEMYAMAGATRKHNGIKENLIVEIGTRLRGSPCRSYSSDQRVSIPGTGSYCYPDIVILCGPGTEDPLDEDTLVNPTAIVEVLSPSTERFDRGGKFRRYREIASLREYVLVSQEEPVIERFARRDGGQWMLSTFAGPEAAFEMVCVPVRIPLADVYRGIEFPPPPGREGNGRE